MLGNKRDVTTMKTLLDLRNNCGDFGEVEGNGILRKVLQLLRKQSLSSAGQRRVTFDGKRDRSDADYEHQRCSRKTSDGPDNMLMLRVSPECSSG